MNFAVNIEGDPWHPAVPVLASEILGGADGPHADYADQWVAVGQIYARNRR